MRIPSVQPFNSPPFDARSFLPSGINYVLLLLTHPSYAQLSISLNLSNSASESIKLSIV